MSSLDKKLDFKRRQSRNENLVQDVDNKIDDPTKGKINDIYEIPLDQTKEIRKIGEMKKSNKSQTEIMVEDSLSRYIDQMQPGQMHEKENGAKIQIQLFRTIQTILRSKGPSFNQLYSHLLETVRNNKDGVFNTRYLWRYFDSLPLSDTEKKNFERILNLIVITSDNENRQNTLKEININFTLDGFNDSDITQRITSYYNSI